MKQVLAGAKFGTLGQQAGRVLSVCVSGCSANFFVKMLLSNFAMKLAGVLASPSPAPPPFVAEEILHTTVHNPMHLATVTQYSTQ